jgi:hypothetical protein
VLEDAEQQVGSLKELLRTPTPENFEAANQKLAGLVSALQSFAAEPSAIAMRNAGDTAFLFRLSSDMAHIRVLLEAPIKYLEGLTFYRAQKFGSYNREGQMKGLGQQTSARTITHL